MEWLTYAGEIVSGIVPALLVLYVTRRADKTAKTNIAEIKDTARSEFAQAIEPALDKFQIRLLDRMNGTYLRTTEALIHFNNIQLSLQRLDNSINMHNQNTQRFINEHTSAS